LALKPKKKPSLFWGSRSELEKIIADMGEQGIWSDAVNNCRVFRNDKGNILNWWATKGTFNCQGVDRAEFKRRVQAAMDAAYALKKEDSGKARSAGSKSKSERVSRTRSSTKMGD
jgi:hypothetical protein